ncbi:response regulator transcription factor [Actinoplanes sp. NPDC000266]
MGRRSSGLWGRRLLVVAPDAGPRDAMTTGLGAAGSAVASVPRGGTAVALVTEEHFDLVIVDLGTPDLVELADCRLSPAARPPVLCVADCDALDEILPEVGDRVEDYVTKPCRVTELLARAQVLLRSRRGALHYGDLVLDDTAYRASRGRQTLDVTPAEYRLLRHLLLNEGRVLTKDQLAWQIWGESRGDNAMERLVSRLRQKVDETGPALIHTRRGFGYWLGEPADM